MSRAMLISCSRRWRSRSRSTRRALSRMLAASPARASKIWRSSLEKAAGRRESRYRTPRKCPCLMLIMDSCVFARDMAKRGITTTARSRYATIGVGDGDGMIHHVAQHYVKRKLGVQQGGRFQEALEFDQAAARRLRAGDV